MIRQQKNPFVQQSAVFFALIFTIFLAFPKTATSQETITRLEVVADQANIRLEPDISSIIIRQVPKGTMLNAVEKKEDWFAVQLTTEQGKIVSGYVHESLVVAIDPVPEVKKPEIIPKKTPVEQEEEQPKTPLRFAISITGGGNYTRGGDLNLGIKGLADLYEDVFGIQREGNIGSVHLGYILGLDFSFPLSEMLSWGIGAEHFLGKNNSQVDYSQGSSSSALHVRPTLSATPLSVFLLFHPTPEFYVKGGISYCLARYSYTYLLESGDAIEQWKGKANAQGLGLMGGLGYVINYSSNLSFVAEISGRLAELQGFTGKEDFRDPSGNISTEEGELYLIKTQVYEDRTHSVLFIRATRPNEAGVVSAEEVQIDFSGISLKIGLRFRF